MHHGSHSSQSTVTTINPQYRFDSKLASVAPFYLKLLQRQRKATGVASDPDSDLLMSLIVPLCRLDLAYFRDLTYKETKDIREIVSWGDVYPNLQETRKLDDNEKLYHARTALRHKIELADNTIMAIQEFLPAFTHDEVLHEPLVRHMLEERSVASVAARRWEAEIRDYLSVAVGHLSLQESRKSIQLADTQIHENKRGTCSPCPPSQHLLINCALVKICKSIKTARSELRLICIVTVLALVLVPLNMATSVFGMNLQQLNGSGKTLSAFFATAIIALLLTGLTWIVLEQIKELQQWRQDLEQEREILQDKPDDRLTLALSVRLAMVAWLIWKGRVGWMLRSRAAWCILTNSPAIFRDFDGDDADVTAAHVVNNILMSQGLDACETFYANGRFVPKAAA